MNMVLKLEEMLITEHANDLELLVIKVKEQSKNGISLNIKIKTIINYSYQCYNQ